jgi:sugar phosphate isomerase/epimerase
MMRRVECFTDPWVDERYPLQWRAIVSIALKDGREYSVRVDRPKGEPENPVTWEELIAKFRGLEVPGLQVTLDYSHFVAVGRPTPDGDVLIPHARRVDARQARRGKVQCRLEEGEIDFEHVVTALTRAGYRGTISTESVCVDYQGCNDLDVVTETLKMKRHIEGLLRKTFPVGVIASQT